MAYHNYFITKTIIFYIKCVMKQLCCAAFFITLIICDTHEVPFFKNVLAKQAYRKNQQKNNKRKMPNCNANIYLIYSCFVEKTYHFY